MVNIILFGPPGIGKSTILTKLKALGIEALDLEDLYPARIRFQIPNMVDWKVIGAADLQPKRSYHNAIKVLLTMPDDEYVARRNARNKQIPGKSNQTEQRPSQWEADLRNAPGFRILQADDSVVDEIVRLYKEVTADEAVRK